MDTKKPGDATRSPSVPPVPLTSHIWRRRLPHWEAARSIYFVTFRLIDSLPRQLIERLRQENVTAVKAWKPASRDLIRQIEKRLDVGTGQCFLAKPEVAETVASALRYFDGKRYTLHAWCVMPNHVHVVFEPHANCGLASILHMWKSYTAKVANHLLRRTGEFWQREYFDYRIRDGEEFVRIARYVAENPLRAGLQNWRWVWVRGFSQQ